MPDFENLHLHNLFINQLHLKYFPVSQFSSGNDYGYYIHIHFHGIKNSILRTRPTKIHQPCFPIFPRIFHKTHRAFSCNSHYN